MGGPSFLVPCLPHRQVNSAQDSALPMPTSAAVKVESGEESVPTPWGTWDVRWALSISHEMKPWLKRVFVGVYRGIIKPFLWEAIVCWYLQGNYHTTPMVETIVCWYLQAESNPSGVAERELDFATIHSAMAKPGVAVRDGLR